MRVKYSDNRISVEEAAEMLSMNVQQVRVLMQRGKLPIGIVYKAEGSSNNGYYIYKSRIEAYLRGDDLLIDSKEKYI